MLESVEAAFDAVALLVQFATIASLDFAVPSARDHGGCSEAFDLRDDRGRVVSLVGQHHLRLASFE